MDLQTELQNRVQPWNLSESKFYRAWSAGKLPVSALQSYAREYGAFIEMIPAGWSVQGDEETAEEEREHAEIWEKFANTINTKVGAANIPAVQNLMAVASELFATPSTAIGALFAFEVQQPETAQSKLEGLRKFYQFGPEVEPYFELHSHNEHEAAKLLARMKALSPQDQEKAVEACGVMARALREALDGIYDVECPGMEC